MDILNLQLKGPDTFNASVITLDKSFTPFTLSCFFDRLNTPAPKESGHRRRKQRRRNIKVNKTEMFEMNRNEVNLKIQKLSNAKGALKEISTKLVIETTQNLHSILKHR